MSFEIKYAPRRLSDVVYPSPAAEAKVASIVSGVGKRSALFCGYYGTGKTILCKLLTEQMWQLPNAPAVRVFGSADYRERGDQIAYSIENELNAQLTDTSAHITCPAIILDEVDKCNYPHMITDIYNTYHSKNWQWYATTNFPHKVDGALADRLGRINFDFHTTDVFASRVLDICAQELGAANTLDEDKVKALLKHIVDPRNPKLGWRRILEAAEQIVLYQRGVISNFWLV